MKGTWKKGSGSESSDVLVYLLDHCLLIIKPKQNEEKYKLYRKVHTKNCSSSLQVVVLTPLM